MEKEKKSPWIPVAVNLAATILSPILEKRALKKNAEAQKGELPKIEVSSGRITQLGGTSVLIYIGYELIQLGELKMGYALIIIGSFVGLGMEYLKGKACNCEGKELQ